MQTFLPLPPTADQEREMLGHPIAYSFHNSFWTLDRQRLGKQRVEAYQLVRAIIDPNAKGWVNHPAAKMWKHQVTALAIYGMQCCEVWTAQGYKDTVYQKIESLYYEYKKSIGRYYHTTASVPWWMGLDSFHRSHQSNLVRKFPEHYWQYFPDVPDNLPYEWHDSKFGI